MRNKTGGREKCGFLSINLYPLTWEGGKTKKLRDTQIVPSDFFLIIIILEKKSHRFAAVRVCVGNDKSP
jgi:hypothetical protein